MQVLSREGLTIGLEISVLYRLNPDSAGACTRQCGGDYETIILIPQFRSISRLSPQVLQASALYSTERERLGVHPGRACEDGCAPWSDDESTRSACRASDQLTEQLSRNNAPIRKASAWSLYSRRRSRRPTGNESKRRVLPTSSDRCRRISDQLLRWKGLSNGEAGKSATRSIIVGAGKTAADNPDTK